MSEANGFLIPAATEIRTEPPPSPITEDIVYQIFRPNWVFALFAGDRSHYAGRAVLVALVLIAIGLILSIFWGAAGLFVSNPIVLLNLVGFSLSLISFGWFTRIIPANLVTLRESFETSDPEYLALIKKWADRIANKNWLMVAAALLFAVPNLFEVRDYWTSGSPPMLLIPWVNSHASVFFAIYYGFLHAVVAPFLLGSGLVGLIGFLLLFNDVFKLALKLPYYRRTAVVVETTAWLVMWALLALAAVLIFSRQLVIFPSGSQVVLFSGLIQSILATTITLSTGLLPMHFVSASISKSKKRELARLEKCQEKSYSAMVNLLETPDPEQDSNERLSTVKTLVEELAIIKEQIAQIENVPNIPIRLFSAARLSMSALLSVGAPIIHDWVLNAFQNK